MHRPVSILILSATLGACTLSGPEPAARASLHQLVQSTVEMNSRDISADAIVTLPAEAGRIDNVKRRPYSDGLHQTIEYDQAVPGLNKNAIDIRLRTNTAAAQLESIAIEKPSEVGIRAELASLFPRMQMRIVENPRSNAYGVYGLAVGTWSNGARCIYAWQWIDGLKTTQAPETSSASLRVRLCRRGVSLDQLAGLIDGVHIEASQGRDIALTGSTERTASSQQPSIRKDPRPRTKSIDSAALHRVPNGAPRQRFVPLMIPTVNRAADVSPGPALDPSIPAAAYRGPTIAAAAGATTR